MTVTHNEDPVEELLGAYALDALEPNERALVDGYLSGNPGFRDEIDGYREAIGVVAHAVVDPADAAAPDHIWDAIAARLEEQPPPLRLVSSRPEPVRRRAWTVRVMGGLAAAAVVAVAVLGVRVVQQGNRIDDLEGDRLAQAAATAMTAPGSEVVTLVDPAGSAVEVRIALQADGVGYIVADSLPALPADRSYQLWAIVDDVVLSAGLLGPDPAIAPFQVTGTIAGLAITEEVAGGVVSSQNDPVALWLRDA